MTRVVLVPGVLALLPEYAGLDDPVPELRAACLDAVAWLGDDPTIVAGKQSGRVARSLVEEVALATVSPLVEEVALATVSPLVEEVALATVSKPGEVRGRSTLVVGNGTATRTERAPGHLDDRAAAFDDGLRRALTEPDPAALAALDRQLAAELWADVDSLAWLGAEQLTPGHEVQVDYDAAPYGVQYWVMRWTCGS